MVPKKGIFKREKLYLQQLTTKKNIINIIPIFTFIKRFLSLVSVMLKAQPGTRLLSGEKGKKSARLPTRSPDFPFSQFLAIFSPHSPKWKACLQNYKQTSGEFFANLFQAPR